MIKQTIKFVQYEWTSYEYKNHMEELISAIGNYKFIYSGTILSSSKFIKFVSSGKNLIILKYHVTEYR
jgi:hypothetical protein